MEEGPAPGVAAGGGPGGGGCGRRVGTEGRRVTGGLVAGYRLEEEETGRPPLPAARPDEEGV